MGVYSGPEVFGVGETNLVLFLDIANVRSYPGSGSTINNLLATTTSTFDTTTSVYKTYDLEVGDYIIPNGPSKGVTYSSADSGKIVFDGVQNYLNITAPNLSTRNTVEIWAKLGTNYSDNTIFGFGNYVIWTRDGGFGFNTSNDDLYGISSTTVSNLGLVGNWKQYVFEMRSDIGYTNNKLYVNGVLQTTSQIRGTETSSNRNFNGGVGRVGAWDKLVGYEMPMDFAVLRIYNRALTQSEITQNFGSTRGRFGI